MLRQSERFRSTAQTSETKNRQLDRNTLLAALVKSENDGKVLKININFVEIVSNIRSQIKEDDNFIALVESIREIGLLQPIVIAKMEDKIGILSGHRRFLAMKKLGFIEILVILRVFNDQRDHIIAQMIENVVRENLEPIDHAIAIATIKKEEKISAERIAQLVGQKDRKYVERLAKVTQWPDEAKKLAREGGLSLTTLMNIAKKADATEKKLMAYIQSAARKSAKGNETQQSADKKVRELMVHWFKTRNLSKDQKSKFRSVAKVYNNLTPNSRELLQDFLDHVCSNN